MLAQPPPVMPEEFGAAHADTRREREDLARTLGLPGSKHDAVREVVDVDGTEYALPGVRKQELARAHHFQWHDHPRTGCRAVDIAGPDDGAVDLAAGMGREHCVLTRDLGIDVRVAIGDERMRLVDIRREVEPEGSHGRQLHEPRNTLLAACRQQSPGPVTVDVPGRPHRGDHRDHGSRVNDEIDPCQLLAPCLGLAHVAGNDVPGRIGREIGAADLGAETAIVVRQGTPDEALRARDEDALRQLDLVRGDHRLSLAKAGEPVRNGPYYAPGYGLLASSGISLSFGATKRPGGHQD
jgi:hypothetical protein